MDEYLEVFFRSDYYGSYLQLLKCIFRMLMTVVEKIIWILYSLCIYCEEMYTDENCCESIFEYVL